MMEDLITDLRNMTGMGRFARAEVREILAYLESVGWLSEPKAAPPPEVIAERVEQIKEYVSDTQAAIHADE